MSRIEAHPLNKIYCTILPGKYSGSEVVPELYNVVYGYWKKTWSDFFAKAGSPAGSLNVENFTRHAFVIALHCDDVIVGAMCSSLFNFSALPTLDHPCINPFPENLLASLRTGGASLCMTGEYLSVNPDFRKGCMGISMAEVLAGIQMKIFRNLNLSASLAATVRAAKVDIICKKFGFAEVGSYQKMGVDCVMLFNTQDKYQEHPDSAVRFQVERLWRNCRDETGYFQTGKQRKKLAA